MKQEVTEIIKKLWMPHFKGLSRRFVCNYWQKTVKKKLGAGHIAHLKFQTFCTEFRSAADTMQFCSKTELYARYYKWENGITGPTARDSE
jgi:hypothetical protein